jgi:tRNA(His) 5'-end guanylyltransferase
MLMSTESEEISLLLSLVLHKGRMAIVKQLVESFADEQLSRPSASLDDQFLMC